MTAPLASEFDRTFDRFGPGVSEEDLPSATKQTVESDGDVSTWNSAVQIRYVHQCARLFGNCVGNFRIGVTQTNDCDTSKEVEVLVSLFVPEFATFTADDTHCRCAIGRHERAMVEPGGRMHRF